MSTPFDLMTPAKAGFLGIAADKSLPKKQRAEALAGAVLVYPEKHKGRRNFQVAFDSDPANGLILPSDPAKNAPRGSSASWTFAVPATREGGQWRPLQTLKLGDKDFLKVAAKVLGPRDAVLLETTGHDDHETVALMGGGNLVSHHLNSPPPESSLVHDVDAQGQPDQERKGGIHYTVRVRKMPRQFCLGGANNDKSTAPPEPGKPQPANYAPMLNFTRNGDGTRADGIAHFGASEAALSAEAGGPLTPANDGQHLLGMGEAPIHQGGVHIRRGLFGGDDAIFSPVEFINTQWEDGAKGPFTRRVEFREDFKAKHINACGKLATGEKKWMTWRDKTTPTETPPTHPKLPPPVTGPPGTPIPPNIEPGRPVIDPGPIPGPALPRLPQVTERPTRSGPAEEEQPSTRHLIFPNGPDAPEGIGPVAFDIFGNGDKGWREAYGITQREFWGAIRASHDVAHGVHTANTPALSGERWPLTKYKPSVFRQDAVGEFYGKRGHGPAKQTLMPGGLEGHVAFKARNENLLPSGYTPTLTRLLLNYKHSGDSREVRTYFGMGAEIPNSVLPASGWYFKLDYTDGHDVPNLDIRSTDSSGLDSSTGRSFKVNGTDITSTVTNAVTAAAVFAAANRVIVADGNDRSADDSDFTMSQNGSNAVDVASGTTFNIGGNVATSIVLGANTSVSGTLASGHTTVAATEDEAAIVAGVDATDGPYEKTYFGDHGTAGTGTAETIIAIRKPAADACIALYVELEAVQSADAGNTHVSTHVVSYYDKAGTLYFNAVVSSATGGTLPQTIAFDASGDDMRVRITDDSNVYRIDAKVRVKWRTTSA